MRTVSRVLPSQVAGGKLVADWIGNWWSEQAGVSSEDGEENIVILISPHTTQL